MITYNQFGKLCSYDTALWPWRAWGFPVVWIQNCHSDLISSALVGTPCSTFIILLAVATHCPDSVSGLVVGLHSASFWRVRIWEHACKEWWFYINIIPLLCKHGIVCGDQWTWLTHVFPMVLSLHFSQLATCVLTVIFDRLLAAASCNWWVSVSLCLLLAVLLLWWKHQLMYVKGAFYGMSI